MSSNYKEEWSGEIKEKKFGGRQPVSMLDAIMKIASMPSKDPFKIVSYSGELPEELKQFVSTVDEVDSSTDNQPVKKLLRSPIVLGMHRGFGKTKP